MIELDKKLLELLYKGTELNNILKLTNLKHYQLAQKITQLSNKGYNIHRSLTCNNIKYYIEKSLKINRQREAIFTDHPFRFIVFSDTHLGAPKERMDLIERLYDYAEVRQINHIFHTGDLIDGYDDSELAINEPDASFIHNDILNFTARFPKKDDIVTSILLGNHDRWSLSNQGIDISIPIMKRRLDINILGYNFNYIQINNRYIVFQHSPTYRIKKLDEEILNCNIPFDLIFRGHFHQNSIENNDNNIKVYVPEFCESHREYAGAFEVRLDTTNDKDKQDSLFIKPLVVTDNMIFSATQIEKKLPQRVVPMTNNKELDKIKKFNEKYNNGKCKRP